MRPGNGRKVGGGVEPLICGRAQCARSEMRTLACRSAIDRRRIRRIPVGMEVGFSLTLPVPISCAIRDISMRAAFCTNPHRTHTHTLDSVTVMMVTTTLIQQLCAACALSASSALASSIPNRLVNTNQTTSSRPANMAQAFSWFTEASASAPTLRRSQRPSSLRTCWQR